MKEITQLDLFAATAEQEPPDVAPQSARLAETNALEIPFGQEPEGLTSLRAGSWVLCKHGQGFYTVAFALDGGKWTTGNYEATAQKAFESALGRWHARVGLTRDFNQVEPTEFHPQPQVVPTPQMSVQEGAPIPQVPQAVPKVKSPSPFAIQDAGAELVANRRNKYRKAVQWSDVAGLNDALKVKQVVKANVWPKPDYQQLISDGMQPVMAHILKQVYDSIASAPVMRRNELMNDEKMRRYIDGVNLVERGVMAWLDDKPAIQTWLTGVTATAGAMLGRSTALTDLIPKKTLLDAVFPEGWKACQAELRAIGSNKVLEVLRPDFDECKKALDAIKKGWPQKREAWEVQGFRVIANQGTKVESWERKDGTRWHLSVNQRAVDFFGSQEEADAAAAQIKPVLLFGKRGYIASFDSEEEAIAAAKEHARPGRSSGISDKGVRVEAVEREGVARRMPGENVTAERMIQEFGLKGVNFGNWLKTPGAREEAQLHLNHAFDAFHDLAEILGVPPKALSLGGMLGLAIGAQGAGGNFAAHFVPGVNEINLTRTSGAGSLGHEFGHALDHYFATQAGLATAADPFLTSHASLGATRRMTVLEDGKYVNKEVPRFGGLRPEIADAFNAIVETMNKRLQTQEEAQAAQAAVEKSNAKGLDGWLKAIRRDFAGHEEAFDVIAEKIRAGNVGEGAVALSSKTYVAPALVEVRDLYKSVRGRAYSIDNLKALQAWVSSSRHDKERAAAQESHVPQKTKTDFALDAVKLDQEKGGKPYWSTNLEKFARAFDAFLSDELVARAARNDYLSHTGRNGLTVPMGDERVAINGAFKGLIGVLRTQETEHGPVLQSFAPPINQAGLPLETIKAEVDRLRRHWPSMPPVYVVHSGADVPFETKGNEDGLYCDGQVYVIADNIVDLKQLQKVMVHECVLHHSLLDMLGAYGFSKLHHGIQALRDQKDPVITELSRNILSRYGELPPHILTMEIVALAGEQCLDDQGNVRIEFGFMKGVYAGIAGWLRDMGLRIPFSNVELQGIMHNCGQWIAKEPEPKRPQVMPEGVTLASFGGVQAQTAPLHTLRAAREMCLAGTPDREIWEQTGWTFAFPDGCPRFEIADDGARAVVEGRSAYEHWQEMSRADPSLHTIGQFLAKYPDSPLTAEFNRDQGPRAAYSAMSTADPDTAREIDAYLSHPELFKAYPQLASIRAAQPLGLGSMVEAGYASYIPEAGLIKYAAIRTPDQFRSTTLHELQHAIQEIEGFSRGGNPTQFQPLDMTDRELSRINDSIHALFDESPAFYRDCVKATQMHLAVVEKYGNVNHINAADPLVKDWWTAIDMRDQHPQANVWFSLKSEENRVARERVVLSPMDQYARLAGEAEARLTQVRIDMSPAERLQGYPLDDMDIAVANQALSLNTKGADLVQSGQHAGKILDIANGIATQRVGRDGATVRHRLSSLGGTVNIGEVVSINYDASGKGRVAGPDRGPSLGNAR